MTILNPKIWIAFIAIAVVPFFAFSQPNAGTKAPKISVTHWVNKGGKPVDLHNKFIVLEFWATWCAPCLSSLPHLNELQKQFSDRENLIFLSMTDEKVERIEKILPRFHFESYVVTDTTGRTSELYGIHEIPKTLLIDADGMVRWTGEPASLSPAVLNDFLTGQAIASRERVVGNALLDSLYTQFRKIFSDKEIKNAFGMSTPGRFYSTKAMSSSGGDYYNVVQMGVKLVDLFANLLQCSNMQIILPSSLEDKAVSYYFKQNRLPSKSEGEKSLLEKVMKELNVELDTVQQLQSVVTLKVTDENKFKQAKVSEENLISSVSVDSSVIALNNSFLSSLTVELQKNQKLPVYFVDEEKYPERYDITLNSSSFENLQKSLAGYGLVFNEETKNAKLYIFK